MKRLIMLTLLISVISFSLPTTVKAAFNKPKSTANFTQQILPLNCIFVTIDTGLNTIRYITPEECGQVITPPASGGSSSGSGSSGGGTTSQPSKPGRLFVPSFTPSIPSPQPPQGKPSQEPDKTLINGHHEVSAEKGYDVDVHPGSVLSYIPLNQPGKQLHHLTITDVNGKGVTLLLDPGKQLKTVGINQTILADTDDRGIAAIAIKLLDKPDHRTAHLRIWLLNDKLTSKEILQLPDSEVHRKFLPAGILVILVTLVFNLTYYHRRKLNE